MKNTKGRRIFLLLAAWAVGFAGVAGAQRPSADPFLHAQRPDWDMTFGVPRGYARPASVWRTGEKSFYEGLLRNQRFDVLVVPFQVQDYAFSREIRSLMTAQLAIAISAAGGGGLSVVDPYLAARALGEGQRGYDMMEVARVANELGVRRIVVGYVGHDRQGSMRLTLYYYDRKAKERFDEVFATRRNQYGGLVASAGLERKHFDRLPYSHGETPIDVCQRLLPDMLSFLGMDPGSEGKPLPVSRLDTPKLPDSPRGMLAADSQPARDAYYFQLLAALTPRGAERTRERFNEKAMLAVLAMSPRSPDYRALKTRGLMNMGLRPAALQALGEPHSAEENHLAALLHGNLSGVRAARNAIPAGVRAAIAALEENALARAYAAGDERSAPALVNALGLPGDVWPFLAARAMTDQDAWEQHENVHLKLLLDRELPVPGFSAEALLQGAAALGDISKVQVSLDLSVLDHVRRQLGAHGCCEPLAPRPRLQDYLNLIEGTAVDNLARRASFLTHTQGRPADALRYLAQLESVYRDHPQLTVAVAEARFALGRRAHGTEREGLLRSAHADALNAFYWEQGQTRVADDAYDVISGTPQYANGRVGNWYASDRPFKPFYPTWQTSRPDADAPNIRLALDNSVSDFAPMDELAAYLTSARKDDEFEELIGSLQRRFVGHPRRIELLAVASERKGDVKAAEAHYRAGIAEKPGSQRLYTRLGKLLFDNAAVARSADVVMSYPGLKNRSGGNAVGLSNYAYEAGSWFYWSGELDHAMPLYRVAADLDTGSEASMVSRARLYLIAGDFSGALDSTLERATRYESAYAYRDYFGLLHAMGRSEEAWSGFATLVPREHPQPWETALVGHRRANASEAQIAEWLTQPPMKAAGYWFPWAAAYLVRAAITDRTPSEQLASRLESLDRPVWKVENRGHVTVARQGRPGGYHKTLGPNNPRHSFLIPGLLEAESTRKERVQSEYAYLARAYRELRLNDFKGAHTVFREAAALFDFRNVDVGYLLPYYAYAAARSGRGAEVESLLARFDVPYQGFDYQLGWAALKAIAGRHAEAMKHIRLARYRRPFTENRAVQTEYQFAEMCEWLFEATGHPEYREVALEWARKNQVLQPWHAWAYAMEAKLSNDPAARARAIAMAHYLDPGSERLSRLPADVVRDAVKRFAARNPFLHPQARGSEERT